MFSREGHSRTTPREGCCLPLRGPSDRHGRHKTRSAAAACRKMRRASADALRRDQQRHRRGTLRGSIGRDLSCLERLALLGRSKLAVRHPAAKGRRQTRSPVIRGNADAWKRNRQGVGRGRGEEGVARETRDRERKWSQGDDGVGWIECESVRPDEARECQARVKAGSVGHQVRRMAPRPLTATFCKAGGALHLPYLPYLGQGRPASPFRHHYHRTCD